MAVNGSEDTGVKATMMDSKQKRNFPTPPTFATKLEERDYLKFRLAQAFRIFGVWIYMYVLFDSLLTCRNRQLRIQ